MLVDSWLLRAAQRHPDRCAINDLTYARLREEVDDTARRMAGRGVRGGDRVALALAPGDAFCIALHAVLRLGAIAVPVDVRLSAAERERIAEGCVEVVDGPVIATSASGAHLRDRHDLGAVAVVVHTSGTSGAPRAIELTYGNWLWSALGSAVALGLDPAERWLCALPLAHVGGLSIVLRSAIYATTALVHERFDTDRVLAALTAQDGPTVVSLVPTTLARLLDAGLRDPPALRWALLGGAAAPPSLQGRAAAAGVPVAATYGLTETCSQVTTLGAPLFCTRVRVAADGALRVVGRKADTIVTGGENVAPAEVEAVLEAHPAVVEAAVHGRADPEWGEAVVATVVVRERVGPDDLRGWCAARLAGYKVPKAIAFAETLPRTASGKLLRRELP